jgi:hypothetical protein
MLLATSQSTIEAHILHDLNEPKRTETTPHDRTARTQDYLDFPSKDTTTPCDLALGKIMALTREHSQTRYVSIRTPWNHFANCGSRFLAILLPALTLCTHTLLALSFALPGSEQYRAFWSLSYNVVAAGASILGLVGAVRVSRRFPHVEFARFGADAIAMV